MLAARPLQLIKRERRGSRYAAPTRAVVEAKLCSQDATEDKLWEELRSRRLDRIKFRRQHNFGPYIVDFVCLRARLIVELDGSQHADSAHDAIRDAELKKLGFRVLRFWNDDVLKDLNGVCDTIIAYARDQGLQPWR